MFVRDALHVRNRNVAFLASFHTPAVIFEQMSVLYALPRLFIGSLTLVLPFFPTGTLERVRPAQCSTDSPCRTCAAAHSHTREHALRAEESPANSQAASPGMYMHASLPNRTLGPHTQPSRGLVLSCA